VLIKSLITKAADRLTPSERRIANTILADYPFSALVSIKELAQHTHVSAPSITRFVHKLGCAGYQDFQKTLIGELRVEAGSPIDLKRRETALSKSGFLADYFARVGQNMRQFTDSARPSDFEAICALMGDPTRSVYLVGGRVSGALASYMVVHLKQLRQRVFHLSGDPETLPDDILRMRRQDVVLMLDFRRYQPGLERLAAALAGRVGCTIVLITDKWISPIGKHSAYVVPVPIETDTPWDSYAAAFAVVEAMIIRISEDGWDASEKRIRAWDDLRAALVDEPDDVKAGS
jgi:DNA-binding MurR/RpiR family transcriptional regulator